MSDLFWNSPNLEPKRNFKFQLYLRGIPTHIVKVAGRPTFKTTETPHKYLGKEFWFPATVTWDPVTVTLIEPIQINSVAIIRDIIAASGYDWMREGATINSANLSTISKKRATEALGYVVLQQISSDEEVVDVWTLKNAWISAIEASELNYDNEELSNLQLTFRYDYATVETPGYANPIASALGLGS